MPIFRVKSVKIYIGQKKFTRIYSWDPWQISGMRPTRKYTVRWGTLLKPWITAVFFTASELVRRDIIAKDKSPLVPLSCCRPRIFTARKNMFDLATGEVFTVHFVFYFCDKPFAYIQPAGWEKRRTAGGLEIWKVDREGNWKVNRDKQRVEVVRLAGLR